MPEGGGRIRHLSVTRRVVRLALTAGALVLVLAAVFVASLGIDAGREAELVRLRVENRSLAADLGRMESQVATLDRFIDGLSERDQQIRLLAGLPYLDPEVQAVGVGGPLTSNPSREEFLRISPNMATRSLAASYDVEKLVRRVELLDASLDEALDSVAVHGDVFRSRPSIRPVQSPDSWISSSFSQSRFHPVLLVNRPHPGLDISAPVGTPFLASAAGRVTFAGTKVGYGKTIEIDHGYGYVTRYAHAASINVKRGQRVSRGEVIGEIGKTGLATAPHLHYEVLVDDRAANPRNYLLDDLVF
ncbi:MAG: M23 family metallopeptidase [Gemmatimonadota bacterium]|nr:M23 family metallopeptidase [Gemmatimonadota bacterium]MDH3427374.1 M23 family metallopeptidase [Gemmatimonadota bacterium]